MAKWTGQTKGSLLGYKIFAWTLSTLGIKFSYFILYFVSYYFYFFSKSSTVHLKRLYKECLGLSTSEVNQLIKKNLHVFAQVLLDRMAVNVGFKDHYTFSSEAEPPLEELASEGKGLILLSGHFGNWEMAGQMVNRLNRTVNVLIFDNEAEKIKGFLDEVETKKYNIIAQKQDMSHLIKIYEVIKNDEVLCLHGDRYVEGAKTIEVDFLGKKAHFPAGPFQMIAKLKAPFAFVFAHKTSKTHYHFTANGTKNNTQKPLLIAQEFAVLLEDKVKAHPDHWFNYYDFFQKP